MAQLNFNVIKQLTKHLPQDIYTTDFVDLVIAERVFSFASICTSIYFGVIFVVAVPVKVETRKTIINSTWLIGFEFMDLC